MRLETSDDSRRQQRVATYFKEVVMNTNPFQTQHIAPDLRELQFDRRTGRHKICGEFTILVWRRQGLTIDLAA